MADPAFDIDKYLAEKTAPAAAAPQAAPAFDLDTYLAEKTQQPSLVQRGMNGLLSADKAILGGIGWAGQKADSYLGAPTRSAIGAAQAGQDPWAAYKSQFGGDPSKAPTGSDIAKKAGVSTSPLGKFSLDSALQAVASVPSPFSPFAAGARALLPEGAKAQEFQPSAADVAGAGIDVAADPTNALLGAGELKNIGIKGLGMLPKGAEIAEGAAGLGKNLASKIGDGAAKVGGALTGIPEQEIKTYAKNADEVKRIAKASDNSTAEAADTMRGDWQKSIQKTRQELGNQISNVLQKSDARIDAQPVLDALAAQKKKINAKLNPEEISQIDALVERVGKVVGQDGTMHVADAHDVKSYLQDLASPTYSNGQIFQTGKNVQRAAKSGASAARKAVNAAEPEIAAANNQLSQLHNVEDTMNRNMISAGKPEASILSAGSGGNPRNAKSLEQLSALTDADMSGDAEKLSAMRTFGKPGLLPVDATGKSMLRTGLGTGLGFLIGHMPGAAVGGALTSPLALRTAIDSGLLGRDVIQKMAASPETAGLLNQALKIESRPRGLILAPAADQSKPKDKDASSD